MEYGTKHCKSSPTIEEYRLHAAILNAIRLLVTEKDELYATLNEDVRYAVDPSYERIDRFEAEQEIAELDRKMMELISDIGKSVEGVCLDDFQRIMDEKAMWVGRLEADDQRRSVAEVTGAKLTELTEILDAYTLDLTAYDDALVHRIVDDVKVLDQDKLLVVFHGRIEIEQTLQ